MNNARTQLGPTKLLGALLAGAFVVFLGSSTPAAASDGSDECCSTCEPCQCVSCFSCGFYVQNAITACCDTSPGNAHCDESLGPGFHVTCNLGWECYCDANGENCTPPL
jgi:hypothetical protein